jgi:hypothetical protein
MAQQTDPADDAQTDGRLVHEETLMAKTTFSGPVESKNGFIGAFSSTSVELQSDNDKKITLDAPNGLAADYSFILPPDDGTSGQVLTTDGDGVTTWTTNGVGTVTSVDTDGTVNGLEITGGPITDSGTITLGGQFVLPQATAAELLDEANAINTADKYAGKMVVDIATGIIYTAVDADVNDNWMPSDASGAVTPVP